MAVVHWAQARSLAHAAAVPVPPRQVPLPQAGGGVLAEAAVALSDLPAGDTSAMDGWAVSGPGPWRVSGHVLAGDVPSALAAGQASAIATGATLPPGADGVLRREWGRMDGRFLSTAPHAPEAAAAVVAQGLDVRRAATECRAGDVVVAAGSVLGPASLGMLAAAGHDVVPLRRAQVDLLVLGDELLLAGPARSGRLRDALGPLLSAWLPARGLAIRSLVHVPDSASALAAVLEQAEGDLVVTTGSTARGPVDHLHRVLDDAGARLLVDGVAVRPGHPQVLAVLSDGRPVVGLPGNPLAAVSGVLTLLEPLAAGLHGRPMPATGERVLDVGVDAGADATRLVPVRGAVPARYAGPAMLRGLTVADAVAVIPPGGVRAGSAVATLALP